MPDISDNSSMATQQVLNMFKQALLSILSVCAMSAQAGTWQEHTSAILQVKTNIMAIKMMNNAHMQALLKADQEHNENAFNAARLAMKQDVVLLKAEEHKLFLLVSGK